MFEKSLIYRVGLDKKVYIGLLAETLLFVFYEFLEVGRIFEPAQYKWRSGCMRECCVSCHPA